MNGLETSKSGRGLSRSTTLLRVREIPRLSLSLPRVTPSNYVSLFCGSLNPAAMSRWHLWQIIESRSSVSQLLPHRGQRAMRARARLQPRVASRNMTPQYQCEVTQMKTAISCAKRNTVMIPHALLIGRKARLILGPSNGSGARPIMDSAAWLLRFGCGYAEDPGQRERAEQEPSHPIPVTYKPMNEGGRNTDTP